MSVWWMKMIIDNMEVVIAKKGLCLVSLVWRVQPNYINCILEISGLFSVEGPCHGSSG
jgi:hypothetical protein